MRVRLDQAMCGTTGQCVLFAPEVFQQDDEGVGEVIEPRPGAEHHERVRLAEIGCPVGAIEVTESG